MRLRDLTPEEMTVAQRKVADEAAAGKRGRIPAPLRAWLYSPELGARAQRLGEFARYDTILGPRLSELAILITARIWTSHYEWYAHKREALKAGLDPDIIAAIAKRESPVLSDGKDQLVYDYVTALQRDHLVSDALHARAVDHLGEQGVVELVGLMGYYTLVAMTLNAFEIGLPDGETSDFPA
ncbi:carboxymuconolactone decarboxylase family protein [Rhodoblastus sp.]|uniref:carboxymuconolactone decarboxylase family protein n=1 Tax=Rhodoblastus sp. TaxID=1962975 RepID=UPI003F9D480B